MLLKLSVWSGFLLIPLLICSCWVTKQVKQVRWQEYTFQLAVSDGGATTSYNWRVTAHDKGTFGTRETKLFEAYGGPFLTDMQVEGHHLVLFSRDNGHLERIELDLHHLDDLLDEPIQYHRYTLKQSSASYIEPDFIKSTREVEQKIDLEMAQRRHDREASQN